MNSYLVRLDSKKKPCFAVIHFRKPTGKTLLIVGDSNYPIFANDNYITYSFVIFYPNSSRYKETALRQLIGHVPVELQKKNSVEGVIKALRRKFPRATIRYAYWNREERDNIRRKFRSLPLIKLESKTSTLVRIL